MSDIRISIKGIIADVVEISQFSKEKLIHKRVYSVKIKASVIVPAYNVESYIHRAIESFMNQTESEIEMILDVRQVME